MRHGDGKAMIPADYFRPALRKAWRTHSFGEIAAATGVAPSTLHRIINAEGAMVQARTARQLTVGLAAMAARTA